MRFILPATLVLAACSGSTEANTSVESDTATATDTMIGCQGDARAASPIIGALAASQNQSVAMVVESVDPQPPARGSNSWVVKLTDNGGSGLTDATVTVTPFMPDHGHGSSTASTATSLGEGRWRLEPLDFMMPGLWEIRLEVTPTGGTAQSLKVGVCVSG